MINLIYESFGLGLIILRFIYVGCFEVMKFIFIFLWENNFVLIYMYIMFIVYVYIKYDWDFTLGMVWVV